MIDFDKREKERAEEEFARMVFWAEIDNACFDHARELAASLRKHLAEKHGDVGLAVEHNKVSLTRAGRRLVISTQDHRTYEVMGLSPVKDDMRKRFATYITERQMMDEVIEWLSTSEGGNAP